MYNILNEPVYLTENFIQEICKEKNAKFVVDTEYKSQKISVFYTKKKDPKYDSRYFGIYIQNDNVMICNADWVKKQEFIGVLRNGEVTFSRHHYDCRYTPDGEYGIDGGPQLQNNGASYYRVLGNNPTVVFMKVRWGKLDIKAYRVMDDTSKIIDKEVVIEKEDKYKTIRVFINNFIYQIPISDLQKNGHPKNPKELYKNIVTEAFEKVDTDESWYDDKDIYVDYMYDTGYFVWNKWRNPEKSSIPISDNMTFVVYVKEKKPINK